MKDDESVRSAIHRALDSMVRPAPELPARTFQLVRTDRAVAGKSGLRRWGQAAGLLVAAALVAVVGIAIHQAVSERSRVGPAPLATPNFVAPTSAAKGPGAAVAWLDNQTGVDANAHIVGSIPASVALRSADGSALYALAYQKVEVYSATTGKLERTIPRKGSGDTAALTPDGRYLTILGGNPQGVEVVDLPAGRSVAYVRLSGAFSNDLRFVLVSADGSRIVAAGNFWQASVVAVMRFDGSTLRVEGQAVSGQQGHSLPRCDGMAPQNAFGGLPERLLPDGNTMVSFCPGDGWVSWVDLTRLTITARVHVQENNPFWLSPMFSTGSMLYVHEPGTGRITSVDLQQRTIVRSAVVDAPTAAMNPMQWLADKLFPPAFAGGIPRSAALSPDGTVLYVTGAFGRGTGVAAIDVRTLHLLSQWKLDGGGSLWLSGDGQAVFVTNNAGDRLSILHLGTGSVVTMTLTPPAYDFLPLG
jgi:DNA-binding beta-propeller fold protein YncE